MIICGLLESRGQLKHYFSFLSTAILIFNVILCGSKRLMPFKSLAVLSTKKQKNEETKQKNKKKPTKKQKQQDKNNKTKITKQKQQNKITKQNKSIKKKNKKKLIFLKKVANCNLLIIYTSKDAGKGKILEWLAVLQLKSLCGQSPFVIPIFEAAKNTPNVPEWFTKLTKIKFTKIQRDCDGKLLVTSACNADATVIVFPPNEARPHISILHTHR